MEAKDLRIGNLLYFKNTHNVAKVDLTHNKHFDCRDEYGSFVPNGNYEPIDLTEEWLLDLGFKIEEIHAGISEADFGHNPVTKDFIITLKNTGEGWFYRNGYFKVQYVHQLQNLFFCLCGEELTLTETPCQKKE